MNKEVVTISSAVLSGALSRGATGYFLDTASNTTRIGANAVLCIGSGYLATKVKGDTTKAAAMRGAAVGIAVAQGLELLKGVFSTPSAQTKLANGSALSKFIAKSAGLGYSEDGLAGYIDADGNYIEDGLGGYIDAEGNFIEDGMAAGYYDENGNFIEEGMGGYIDEQGNFIEDGMGAYIDENGYLVEDGLNAYVDEDGNTIL